MNKACELGLLGSWIASPKKMEIQIEECENDELMPEVAPNRHEKKCGLFVGKAEKAHVVTACLPERPRCFDCNETIETRQNINKPVYARIYTTFRHRSLWREKLRYVCRKSMCLCLRF